MDDVIEIYDSDSNECTVTGEWEYLLLLSFEVINAFVIFLLTASNIPGVKRKYDHSSDSDSYSSYTISSGGSERKRITNAGPILVEDSSSESEYEGDEWDKDCKVVDVVTTLKKLYGCKYNQYIVRVQIV